MILNNINDGNGSMAFGWELEIRLCLPLGRNCVCGQGLKWALRWI